MPEEPQRPDMGASPPHFGHAYGECVAETRGSRD